MRLIGAIVVVILGSIVLFEVFGALSLMWSWTPSGEALGVYSRQLGDRNLMGDAIQAALAVAWYSCGVLPTIVGLVVAGGIWVVRTLRNVQWSKDMFVLGASSIVGFAAWLFHAYGVLTPFGIWPLVGLFGYSAFVFASLLIRTSPRRSS